MDIKLNYIEEGMGEPLIFLHGNGENLSYFHNQTEFFSRHYRVIAIDTRGHGDSPRGTASFTIEQFAEDLYAFLKEKQIIKTHILGFSDGGNIAIQFALKHPEYINKLILNGANIYPRGVKRSAQLPIEIGYKIVSAFADISPKARAKAELLGLMVNEPNICPEELKRITVPTLVIAGTSDMITKEHTELIHNSIPGSKIHYIEGDHFIAAKRSDEFNRVVLEFLQNSTR